MDIPKHFPFRGQAQGIARYIWTSATVYIVAKGEQWQWVIDPANSTLEQPPNVAKCVRLNSFPLSYETDIT